MADVAEEGGLGAIDFRHCFDTLALFLISARVSERGCDVRGDGIGKKTVVVVQ